jgi:hypothetical protein
MNAKRRYSPNRISRKGLIKLYERSFKQMRISFGGAAHFRLLELKDKERKRREYVK